MHRPEFVICVAGGAGGVGLGVIVPVGGGLVGVGFVGVGFVGVVLVGVGVVGVVFVGVGVGLGLAVVVDGTELVVTGVLVGAFPVADDRLAVMAGSVVRVTDEPSVVTERFLVGVTELPADGG